MSKTTLPQGNSYVAPEHVHCRKHVLSGGAGIQRSSDKLQLCYLRPPISGLASLLCRSSDSFGEFRRDECAAPVKLLEDEVQHVFLGRRLRVWQKVPPERHAFLVGDNHFTDAWVLHGLAFASEAKIPRSDPRRGYCPVESASVIVKRGDVTPLHIARVRPWRITELGEN
jgi:hypothetical protein